MVRHFVGGSWRFVPTRTGRRAPCDSRRMSIRRAKSHRVCGRIWGATLALAEFASRRRRGRAETVGRFNSGLVLEAARLGVRSLADPWVVDDLGLRRACAGLAVP